jgi:enoyl-CoA hydratase
MQNFALTLENHIAHLVLNCPSQMNTMSPLFWAELDSVLQSLHRDTKARVLVISSTGKHFSAGMALDTFSGAIALNNQTAADRAAIFDQLVDMQATFTRLDDLRIPVIAAIQGGCIGAGLDLVTACDIRLCSDDAFFCVQEINIGMTADVGTLQRLPKLIPPGVAREMAYTGSRLGSARALAVGLVNTVHDDHAAAVAAALAMAQTIAQKAPVAIWGSKQALNYARDHSTDDALRQMGWLQAGIWDSEAVAAAITAWQEKRQAQFDDLAPVRGFSQSAS